MNSTNHKLRVASCGLRAAQSPRGVARSSSLPIPHSAFSIRRSSRRGISLLEVLISMFVLLFGLMGVAAVFPVGNHYAGKGEQYDRGAALTEAGFAELKARGMLKPELWLYADDPTGTEVSPLTGAIPGAAPARNFRYSARSPVVIQHPYTANSGQFNVTDTGTRPGYTFVIDPFGAAAGLADANITTGLDVFPYVDFSTSNLDGVLNNVMPPAWRTSGLPGTYWPIRRVTLPAPDQAAPANTTSVIPLNEAVAETIFRLHDDVTTELPAAADRPGVQQWRAIDQTSTPDPKKPWQHTLLARNYTGSYSWFATIAPTTLEGINALQPIHPRFGSELYEVSVAVCHKRNPLPSADSERTISAQINVGNELVIYDANAEVVSAAADKLRAGNWIAIAGVHQGTGQFLMKWYKVLSIDDETAENQRLDASNPSGPTYAVRRLMLEGPDWPIPRSAGFAADLRAIIVPGIISVTTQYLPMESM